jgi:hypothetical protein
VQGQGLEIQRVFKHIPCGIGAEEAEEVGVEHLLRVSGTTAQPSLPSFLPSFLYYPRISVADVMCPACMRCLYSLCVTLLSLTNILPLATTTASHHYITNTGHQRPLHLHARAVYQAETARIGQPGDASGRDPRVPRQGDRRQGTYSVILYMFFLPSCSCL